jgi:hypothetical protein|nr:MAG TPA: hypothetical protein [Caudoviricetes sp.]
MEIKESLNDLINKLNDYSEIYQNYQTEIRCLMDSTKKEFLLNSITKTFDEYIQEFKNSNISNVENSLN